jgi:hypothetical protein
VRGLSVSDLLDYQKYSLKPHVESNDPALQALLWGLVMGIALAMLLGALAVLDGLPFVASNTTLIRKLLVTTPVWITAIAYAGLIRTPRTRTRATCAIICTVIACVVAGAILIGIQAIFFAFSGSFD